jgi:hypothetical protein
VESSSTFQLALAKALEKVNDTTTVALKTFTLGVDSKTVSIDNAVLGILPKSLLFAMLHYFRDIDRH